ncbi:MAG: hypothetical protein N4A71_00925 [Carboxylicivirga sp.]|jgi:branched-subunit amino acid transport protein|nr:hypothetical protein [Carboxylicivirga sp.]
MKSFKHVLAILTALIYSNVVFAHDSIVPHVHDHAHHSDFSIGWTVIFTIVAIVAVIITLSKYFNYKAHNNKQCR